MNASHRVNVTADVEQGLIRVRGRRLWFMAEPKTSHGLSGLLRQSLQPAAPVVIAADPIDLGVNQLGENFEHVPELVGHPQPGVDQIAEDHQSVRSPSVAEREQTIQGAGIAITGEGDAMGLKAFGLAQMQIRHHQDAAFLSPKSPFRKKTKTFLFPSPQEWITHSGPVCGHWGNCGGLWHQPPASPLPGPQIWTLVVWRCGCHAVPIHRR